MISAPSNFGFRQNGRKLFENGRTRNLISVTAKITAKLAKIHPSWPILPQPAIWTKFGQNRWRIKLRAFDRF
jgi:hypothetical protein